MNQERFQDVVDLQRAVTAEWLVERLPLRRWPIGVELDFQNAVAEWLNRQDVRYEREYHLREADIIDFYFPDGRIGLELKVKGSPAAVMRQLQRYARSPEVDALILMTGHASLAAGCADMLAGKPVHVVATWAGGL
jgi:hypothetical protein